jgi:hypothetical protein
MSLGISWSAEPAPSVKFKGTQDTNNYELTLTRAGDGSTTTASLTLNITTNLGSITLPGDYDDAKAFFTAVGAAL